LLAYREDPSFFAVARALRLHHQTVQRCVERAVVEGPIAALDDRPRSGRARTITLVAKAWLASLTCRKAKELGYPHELRTTRLLALHAREHGPAEGDACVANLAANKLSSSVSLRGAQRGQEGTPERRPELSVGRPQFALRRRFAFAHAILDRSRAYRGSPRPRRQPLGQRKKFATRRKV
jgi:hypothetical protein